MPRFLHQNLQLFFALGVSYLGLFFTALFSTSTDFAVNIFPWRRQLVSLLFCSLCLFAVGAVFFPRMCSKSAFNRQFLENLSSDRYASVFGVKFIHGHHPPLECFSNHEFHYKSKTFCAGCFGILVGALGSVAGFIAYSLTWFDLSKIADYILILGLVAVAWTLVFPLLYNGKVIVRLLNNIALVFGMSMILLATDTLLENLEVDIYVVGLGIFWMITKILISKYNHRTIYATESNKTLKGANPKVAFYGIEKLQ